MLGKFTASHPTLHCRSRSTPTYILSECVLVYMEPAEASQLVTWLGEYFSNAAMVVYEQVRVHSDGSAVAVVAVAAVSGFPSAVFQLVVVRQLQGL